MFLTNKKPQVSAYIAYIVIQS